jgi:hypothetical protein
MPSQRAHLLFDASAYQQSISDSFAHLTDSMSAVDGLISTAGFHHGSKRTK